MSEITGVQNKSRVGIETQNVRVCAGRVLIWTNGNDTLVIGMSSKDDRRDVIALVP